MLSQENINAQESNGPGELNDPHALLEKVQAARGRVGAALHRRLELLAASRLLETSDGVQALIQEIGVDGGFRAIFKEGKLDLSIGVSEEEGDTPGKGSLKSLHVNCGLQSVASGQFAKLDGTMTALDVSGHTHLVHLPAAALCGLTSLKELECTGCPQLLSLPLEVTAMGGADSMLFLREYEKEPTNNDSLALFLVGGGECGKTSVKRALVNEDANVAPAIDKDTRTVGMDMEEWSTVDNAGQVLNLKIKDVGGQDLYIHLHELFLLRRAVYLFMWRADHDLDKVRHDVTVWLNLLQSRVPGVAVLPVVTHIDCVSASDLEQQCQDVKAAMLTWEEKQKKLENATEVPLVRVLNSANSFRVNCLKGEGVAQLRKAVLDAAETTRGFREPMPKSWVQLRDQVREMAKTQRYMSWTEFTTLAQQDCGITDKMLLPVTSFLHETLELRFFGLEIMKRRKENLEDFLTGMLGARREGSDGSVADEARALFDKIDENGNGAIDDLELRKYLQRAGLNDANVQLMLQGADDDHSGQIDFEEFRKRFEDAHMAAKNNDILSSTVYLNVPWMVDILKGIVRHDHAALLEYLQDNADKHGLMHQARRMRVQGIIHKDLFDQHLLWPGSDGSGQSGFWTRVADGNTKNFTYERQLWDDGAGGLKKVVGSEDEKKVAIGLLEGFKVVIPVNDDKAEFICQDLVPPHRRNATDSRSLDAESCKFWFKRVYSDLPFGFWSTMFMEIRSLSTSGSTSTHIQAFYQLSAKIQILRTQDHDDIGLKWIEMDSDKPTRGTEIESDSLAEALQSKATFKREEWEEFQVHNLSSDSFIKVGDKFFKPADNGNHKIDGNHRIEVRASTGAALKAAGQVLDKVTKFYPGLALWEVSRREIDSKESTAIIEPAQVLVMTAENLFKINNNATVVFNKAMKEIDDLDQVKTFFEEAGSKVQPNEESGGGQLELESEELELESDGGSGKSWARLSRNIEHIEALRSRLTIEDVRGVQETSTSSTGTVFTGSYSLADISADMGSLVQGVILPAHGRCLREEKRRATAAPVMKAKKGQVLDASMSPSVEKLDRALFKALKKRDTEEAKKLLHQGADPSWTVTSCCVFVKSCVVEANKDPASTDLLHSFGCDDQDLSDSSDLISLHVQSGERLEAYLSQMSKLQQGFSQPRSMLPKQIHAGETESSHSTEFIQTLYRVIDDHFDKFSISKEIYSPHILFNGRAQLVMVLLDEKTSQSKQVCDRFRELEQQGCKVIGVVMPGYVVKNNDYSTWWPLSMPGFANHSLFFDCRAGPGGDQWNAPWLEDKMKRELMPQMHQFLEEWTDHHPMPQLHQSLEEWTDHHPAPGIETSAAGSDARDRPAPATVPGPLQARVYVSKEEMRESILPCPNCLKLGKANPGGFKRDECMLSIFAVSKDTNTKGTLLCFGCKEKVKVKDILRRPLFLSYNWGYNNSTQKIAVSLCKRIFLATEMPYWLDVDGGMGFGDELITEMREGVAGCDIVILMISDAFCNSGNCLREFVHTVNHRKHIIPLLVPDHGDTRTGPSGWTGEYSPGDEDWWKHAERICKSKDPDASDKEIQWSYLSAFTPIDLRNESLNEDGSLQDHSDAEKEIILRVMSRFFRSSVQSGSSDNATSQ